MIVIDNYSEKILESNNYVALGSFDGLHKGHLSLINKAVEVAEKKNGKSMVFTFKNHPRCFMDRGFCSKLIMENEKKIEILEDEKVDILCFKDFDTEFMKLTPKEFIQLLIDKYNAKGIIVGFNYKFGYKNLGNVKLLEELKEIFNYELYVIDKCLYDGDVISSTRIRNLILEGDVSEAAEMLSRPYSLTGEVVHGRKIGRTMGFPTANLDINKNLILPKVGVYYTNVKVNNNIYKGITNIGNNPTVNGKKITIETYILDFDEDIYGEHIEGSFIKKIRDGKKFNGLQELKEELERNKEFARNEKLYI